MPPKAGMAFFAIGHLASDGLFAVLMALVLRLSYCCEWFGIQRNLHPSTIHKFDSAASPMQAEDCG
ncbi:hypothetical protein SynA1825c_02036 [Synechococcus sp. A18-25c]|nr:hypothetical protein SynA1825c_02036 [Synechococcus sp. A18-25c]